MKPCATCPFRRGAKAADMPGGFDVAWAAEVSRDAGLASAMLTCHSREPGIDALCAGWLNDQARSGVESLPLRFALIAGRVKLPEVDPDLLTYDEMIAQMRRDPTAKRRSARTRKDPQRENLERVRARLDAIAAKERG